MSYLNKKRAVSVTCIIAGAISFVAASSSAQNWSFESVGVRGGTSINERSETFRQIEIFTDLNLPWHWQLGNDWHISTRLECSAGWLRGEKEDAVLGTLGPLASLRWKEFPLTLEAGSSPTLLSRYRFGVRDFGMPFQFTTHVGLNWEITHHFSLGYRYEHMSNAGLAKPNPGLNLQLLSVSYHF